MSVTAPLGFRAAGVAAGLKPSGDRDVAVVINDGPSRAAAAVFTTNRVQAAPVKWSRQVVSGGRVRAVVLNSGGANACTGPLGFQDTHATAERLAAALDDSAGEIAVCSTGLIGERLPMDKLLPAVDAAVAEADRSGGVHAADAIRTTDTSSRSPSGAARARAGGPPRPLHGRRHGQGRGHARPGAGDHARRADHRRRPHRRRSSTRRCAARPPSPSTGSTPTAACPPTTPCCSWPAARPASSRTSRTSPGRSPRSAPTWPASCSATPRARRSTSPSRSSARRARPTRSRSAAAWRGTTCSSARSPGSDPNWGRVLSAVGTTDAVFDPDRLNVAMNGVWVCRAARAGRRPVQGRPQRQGRHDHRRPVGRAAQRGHPHHRPDRGLRARELGLLHMTIVIAGARTPPAGRPPPPRRAR